MIHISIYGFNFIIHSNSEEIFKRLNIDFEEFITNELNTINLNVFIKLESKLTLQIPKNRVPTFQRKNSITYDIDNIRYNDYYGSVITKFSHTESVFYAHGTELNKLYEVIYLFILSRSGKYCDLKGMHKIHGFSISSNSNTLICMQSSRGGKSTLLNQLLRQYQHEYFFGSDDSPLIDSNTGEVLAFPIHVNLGHLPNDLELTNSDYYLQQREFYSAKYSIRVKSYKREIAKPTLKYTFCIIRRSSFEIPQLSRISKLQFFLELLKHLVIGFGLPIIFEYFWESSYKDFFLKTKIFLSRLRLAISLTMNHKAYNLYLTENIDENAKCISQLLGTHSQS